MLGGFASVPKNAPDSDVRIKSIDLFGCASFTQEAIAHIEIEIDGF